MVDKRSYAPMTSRRGFISTSLGAVAAIALAACSSTTASTSGTGSTPSAVTTATGSTVELRIGYQKSGVLVLLKGQRALEKRLSPGVSVSWLTFTSGPPLLEAIHAGSIDFGTTGDTPPIFAQAAGTPLVYVASTLSSGAGSGIVVPEKSPLKSGQDLKGKKIAFTKASASHLLLIRALEKAGLKYADIEPAFLQPPDARAAFQGGSVDAWVIWDPFYSAVQQDLKARVLVDGKDVGQTRGFFLASQNFVRDHAEILRSTIDELQKGSVWAQRNTDAYAKILSDETGIAIPVWKQVLQVDTPNVTFMDETALAYQQNVADIFFGLGLIPKKLDVSQTSWQGAN